MRLRVFLGVVAVLVLSSFAIADPGRNAFLTYTPSSKAELLRQFDTNKAVRDKYMRHYSMSETEVRAYLSSLQVKRLTHTGTYTVYSVPSNGEVKSHMETLKAGERVFFDQEGNPVLKARCGNPLGRGPKKPTPNELQANVIGTPVDVQSVEGEGPVMEDLVVYAPPPVPVLPELPPVTPETPITPPETPIVTTTGSKPQPFAIPALLAGSVLLGGDTGGSSNQPIPEPATMFGLAAGASYLVARRRKK